MDNRKDIIIYRTADGKASVSLYARDGKIWLSQQQMADLFAVSRQTISHHVCSILKEKELDESSAVTRYMTAAADGKSYSVVFYSLEMIIAVGFRTRGIRGTQFRQWAASHLKEYLVKGFTMDDERLKNPDGRPDYFDELLARIRDIRASGKRFYQKVRDLLALSSDYDSTDKATQMFFAETQNKLLYAVTEQTAAEIISSRANAALPNMGLTSWEGSVVRKKDIIIAKNYLLESELDSLNRLVDIFLTSAEERVKNRHDLTMDFWKKNVDALLNFQGKPLLQDRGRISKARADEYAGRIYEEFDARRRQQEAAEADAEDLAELGELEKQLIMSKRNADVPISD
ncbi:MAG: virulence RhuM family protein [Succinivibrionaceae bacterium]|nr:virulence RhuM family protein [Succinivibrionaceae bacterium]